MAVFRLTERYRLGGVTDSNDGPISNSLHSPSIHPQSSLQKEVFLFHTTRLFDNHRNSQILKMGWFQNGFVHMRIFRILGLFNATKNKSGSFLCLFAPETVDPLILIGTGCHLFLGLQCASSRDLDMKRETFRYTARNCRRTFRKLKGRWRWLLTKPYADIRSIYKSTLCVARNL